MTREEIRIVLQSNHYPYKPVLTAEAEFVLAVFSCDG